MVFLSRVVFQCSLFSLSLMSAASALAMDANNHANAHMVAAASTTHSSHAATNAPSGYVPATKYDNTPYRFNMNQNGKKMTAEEFDAWMKSRGIHVVKARPESASTPAQSSGN